MRTPIMAGNWKMNKTPDETESMIKELVPLAKDADCTVVICTPACCLPAALEAAFGTNIQIGAQNCHFENSGAFTGETSPATLKAMGIKYVIVGHSERRQYFGETDETVNLRAKAALANGLIPIICVGESLEQREAGVTETLVKYQTQAALSGMSADEVRGLVIAYEPIWAIGTGKNSHQRRCQSGKRIYPRAGGKDLWQRRSGGHTHTVRRLCKACKRSRAYGDGEHRRRLGGRCIAYSGQLLTACKLQ